MAIPQKGGLKLVLPEQKRLVAGIPMAIPQKGGLKRHIAGAAFYSCFHSDGYSTERWIETLIEQVIAPPTV